MTYADRWLLPDGVEEILPTEAKPIELLRRQLLDLYSSYFFKACAALRGPLRVRALVRVRWPRMGKPRR